MDAATPLFYIAIKDLDRSVVIERHHSHKELKGEALLSVVQEMFVKNHYNLQELAYLCTTKGPGSLTGLRIAMSLIKTMGQILKLPIISIPTLYALESSYTAKVSIKPKKIMTCLTARKNHYYVKFSEAKEDAFEQLTTGLLCEKAKDVNILLCGSGLLSVCDKQQLNSVIVKLSPEVIFNLCEYKFQKEEYENYMECQPEYAGKSVAEKNLKTSK